MALLKFSVFSYLKTNIGKVFLINNHYVIYETGHKSREERVGGGQGKGLGLNLAYTMIFPPFFLAFLGFLIEKYPSCLYCWNKLN
jgi:hypothetical protein